MPKATNNVVSWPPKEKGWKPAPRPTSVKIGHLEFSIHFIPETEWTVPNGNDPDLQGIFLANQGRINIRVQNDVHEQVLRETLWHEILHGCWWFMGMASLPVAPGLDKESQEEDVVLRVTHCTFMVMQDNPDVMAYLSALLFSAKVHT
jgi:hypothetical protein